MKANLGSGPYPADGWLNLDLCSPLAQVHASLTALPLADGVCEVVYLGHVLEHLEFTVQLPAALAEVARVLAPGGEVMVVGPCLERAVASGQPYWLLRQIITGEGDAGSDPGAHRWCSTALLTSVALRAAGFSVQELPVEQVCAPSWPNTCVDGWQFALRAYV